MTKKVNSAYSMGTRAADSPRGGKVGMAVVEALEEIRGRSDNGLLNAEDVVHYASDEEHPLHRYFTWDDEEAAYRCRLHEARSLINSVTLITQDRAVPAYVSDKRDSGSGFEPVELAMSNANKRRRLLNRAFQDLQRVQKRYAMLEELMPVFKSVDRLASQFDEEPKKKRAASADARDGGRVPRGARLPARPGV